MRTFGRPYSACSDKQFAQLCTILGRPGLAECGLWDIALECVRYRQCLPSLSWYVRPIACGFDIGPAH